MRKKLLISLGIILVLLVPGLVYAATSTLTLHPGDVTTLNCTSGLSANANPVSGTQAVLTCANPDGYQLYYDSLASPWVDFSYTSTINWSNTATVYGGSDAISFTNTGAFGAWDIHNSTGVDTTGYSDLEFYINGGSSGTKTYFVALYDTNSTQLTQVNITSVPANTWTKETISLTSLNGANKVIKGVILQSLHNGAEGATYIDNVRFVANATSTPTSTATATNTPTSTNTPTVTPTFTLTPTSTFTRTATNTGTVTNTPTGVLTNTPTPTSTPANAAVIYDDQLQNAWLDYSWNATTDFANTSPAHTGSKSVAFTLTAPQGGFNLHNVAGINTTAYDHFDFWIYPSSSTPSYQICAYDSTSTQIAACKPLSNYGVPASGVWTHYSILLSDIGANSKVVTGFLLQDLNNAALPVVYFDDIGLVTTGIPATSTPTATNTPGGVAWGNSEPFTSIPNAADESYQSKGAEQMLPFVKAAVNDAINAGLLNENERQLWENVELGTINVESTGHVFLLGGNSTFYSEGLTQNTSPWLTYAEEDPSDALTNIRSHLRTLIRYYRKWGNRWDRAVGEYLTGSEDPTCQQTCGDGNTTGFTYAERVVNAVWWVHYNAANGLNYPAHNNDYQGNLGSNNTYNKAPLWSIWSPPNLAYNWVPPHNQNGYNYYTQGVDSGINSPIDKNTWFTTPAFFWSAAPESVAAYTERTPTSAESQEYPLGHTTVSGPNQETYPRRTWTTANP